MEVILVLQHCNSFYSGSNIEIYRHLYKHISIYVYIVTSIYRYYMYLNIYSTIIFMSNDNNIANDCNNYHSITVMFLLIYLLALLLTTHYVY